MSDLSEAIQKAAAHHESLSAVDKALADEQQRRSWVIGETGRDPGFSTLALEVLRLRRELAEQRGGKLNADEARRLWRLKKRAYHLQNRIDRSPRMDMSHDKAELSALRWAVEKISGETLSALDGDNGYER